MLFTSGPERDKISPEMKTAAAGNYNKWHCRREMHTSGLYASAIRAASSMSCPHIVSLMFQSERTDGNKECDSVSRGSPRLSASPVYLGIQVLLSTAEWHLANASRM